MCTTDFFIPSSLPPWCLFDRRLICVYSRQLIIAEVTYPLSFVGALRSLTSAYFSESGYNFGGYRRHAVRVAPHADPHGRAVGG